jgi:hypothetical protein
LRQRSRELVTNATATKPMEGETPKENKARIDRTISIKRKLQ